MAARSGREEAGRRVLHDCHSRADVSDRRAVVDQRLPFSTSIKGWDVPGPDLELQRGGDAVEREHAIVLVVLSVRVQVDEARRDDEAFCIEGGLAGDRRRRDRFDLAVPNPDESRRVEARLGIDHAPVGDHDVVLRLLRTGDRPQRQEYDQHRRESAHHISIFFVGEQTRRPIIAAVLRRNQAAGALPGGEGTRHTLAALGVPPQPTDPSAGARMDSKLENTPHVGNGEHQSPRFPPRHGRHSRRVCHRPAAPGAHLVAKGRCHRQDRGPARRRP